MNEKHYWPSTWVFILAAIGSAAGLGNLWRFPAFAFDYGGAAYVFAVLLANIVIGIPLLIAEIGLGQKIQKSAPDALASIRPVFRYIGWMAVSAGFIVITYYMTVMGWGIDYLFASFSQAWSANSNNFFFSGILGLSDGIGKIGGFSAPVLAGSALAWILVYFSVWKGVRSVSSVVKWTATAPFVILLLLIIRAVTLDGAFDGLKLFFIPDWNALSNPQLWLAAFSQVFFSLSLAFGIMIAYGSFNPDRTEITKSALIITAGNFLVSIMSGVVVFGTLGYMAHIQGVGISDVFAGGPALAFVVFPQVISLLPAFSGFFAIIFFLMFLSLAVDSAFSLVEAFAAPFRDRFPSLSTKHIAFWICGAGFIGGLIYTTNAGLYFLDIVDHFIVNYAIILVGIFEALIIGWFIKGNEFINYINERSKIKIGKTWQFLLRFIIPLFLTGFLVLNAVKEFVNSYGGYPKWALLWVGAGSIILTFIMAFVLERVTASKKKSNIL